MNKSFILPLFLGDQRIYDNYCEIFPHFKETFVKQICYSISLHILELNKIFVDGDLLHARMLCM